MSYQKAPQKLVSFTENKTELEQIASDMENGWNIVSLVRNGNYYAGIMEYKNQEEQNKEEPTVYIPPRKKIKISS